MNPIIIVPDEHGRGLWKNGLKYFNENPESKMIFLGDYLDPYIYHENITREDAYNNFLEILEFARNNRERVILLWGNHDRYYSNRDEECCRHDYKNYAIIAKLFKDNEDLFQFAYREGDYLFTHAGVCTGWLLQNNLTHINEDNIVEYLNSNPKTLWQVGESRGGFHDWGSPLWCCWMGDWEQDECKNPFKLKQIIGHTRLEKGRYSSNKKKNIYMMDVRNCFLLENDEFILLSPEN